MAILLFFLVVLNVAYDFLVVIKIFQNERPVVGIVALLCPPFCIVFGWMNAGRYKITNVMIVWSILIAAFVVVNVYITKSQ